MSKKNTPYRMNSLTNIILRWVNEEIEALGVLNKDYQIEAGRSGLSESEREYIIGVISGQDAAIIKLQELEDRLKQLLSEVNEHYYLAEKTNKEGYTYITKEGFVTWE